MDKAIGEAIKSAIDDATGYRSAFRESVKKQLAEAMPHGVSIDEVAKFQQVFNNALTSYVSGANADTIRVGLTKAMEQCTPTVPAKISLTQFMKDVREGFHKEDNECFFAEMEISEYGSGHLYLDRDSRCRSKYRASIALAFTKDGEVYTVKMDGQQLTPKSVPNVISHLDGLLMAMYVGRTALEVDMDADDVSSAAQVNYD